MAEDSAVDYRTAMLVFNFDKTKVPDLRDALYKRFKIWVHPDYLNAEPGMGIRISCHYSLSEKDLDHFVDSLESLLSDHD